MLNATVTIADRPYLLGSRTVGSGRGHAYRLTSEEARNILATYPVTHFTPNRLTLAVIGGPAYLVPATYGGGDAFERA